jgi:hypothetical protein
MRRFNTFLFAALLAGCSGAPSGDARPADVAQAPAPSAPSAVARQTFEIEPGHTLTVTRFDDDSLAFAETGVLGKHTERLGTTAKLGSIGRVVQAVAPGAVVSEALGSPAQRAVVLDSLIGGIPFPPLPPVGQPITTDVPTVGNFPAWADDYATLHCSDPATSWCLPHLYGSANTGWDYGGWYRSFAFNRAASGNATFVVNNSASQPVATLTLGPGQWGAIQYLSNTKAWANGQITGPAGANVGVSSLVTEIAPRSQEHLDWCWIASSQMVMAALGDPHDQCALVAKHFNATDVCSNPAKYDTSSGEAAQILEEQGYAYNFFDPNDVTALAQALQSGPVILHHPRHYTVLSDYREVLVNGSYVKEALFTENGKVGDTDQPDFATWVDISKLGSNNGGDADRGISDVHRIGARSRLQTVISRVAWSNNVATAKFDSSDATSFNYQFLDAGGATLGPVWNSGSMAAMRDWQTNSSEVSYGGIGGWLWYAVNVQACANGACGSWVSTKSVSLTPIAHIDSVTWANNVETATVHADAAPAETFFRYRFVDSGDAHMQPWHAGQTGAVGAASTSLTLNVGYAMSTQVQVQACSQNGCSAWVTQSFYTH